MKQRFHTFTVRTAYDALLQALYWSVLGSMFLALLSSVYTTALPMLSVNALALLWLFVYRLRLCRFPPRHPRVIYAFLSSLFLISFGTNLLAVFHLSYSLSLFLNR